MVIYYNKTKAHMDNRRRRFCEISKRRNIRHPKIVIKIQDGVHDDVRIARSFFLGHREHVLRTETLYRCTHGRRSESCAFCFGAKDVWAKKT